MELLDTYVKGVRKVATMILKSNNTSGFQSGSALASTIVSASQNTSTTTQELPDESFLTAQSIGTQPFLAFLYIVLSFLFPYFYYPYYTFFLSGRQGGNGSNRQNNGMVGGSKK